MKKDVFMKEAKRFEKYFNEGIYEETAKRSVYCKAGRLEIYAQLYKGKLSANIFTHPNETAFESGVLEKYVKTMDECVKLLKEKETELKKMKSWWEE